MKQYNSFSRFLASLLCVLLCVGMLPLTAFATGDAARAGKTPGIRAVKYSYDGAEWSDLTAGTSLTGQTVYLCALFTPAESLAPLNPAASTFTLDGTEVGAGEIYGSADAPEGVVLCLNGEGGIAVANGQHTVTVTLTDTDGASASESVSFITLCDTNSMTALAFAPCATHPRRDLQSVPYHQRVPPPVQHPRADRPAGCPLPGGGCHLRRRRDRELDIHARY